MARLFRPGDEPVPGYRLKEPLGKGNFGQVWRADGNGVPVALKIIDNLDAGGGLRELKSLQLLKEIRHPFLVPLQGYWLRDGLGRLLDESAVQAALRGSDGSLDPRGTMPEAKVDDPQLLIAMGLGEKTLYDHLLEKTGGEGKGGLSLKESLSFLSDAAEAIDHLNVQCKIQHLDIKPQNILIVANRAQVCDFGLARMIGNLRQSKVGRSPGYSAPEVDAPDDKRGIGPNAQTDQYSLAVTYFELRTGRLPFFQEDLTAEFRLTQAKCEGRLDLAGVSDEEAEALRKALSPDAKRRFATCREFYDQLVECTQERPELKQPGGSVGGRLAVAALLLLTSLAVGGWAWGASDPEKRDAIVEWIHNLFFGAGEENSDSTNSRPVAKSFRNAIRNRVNEGRFADAWDLAAELPPGQREEEFRDILTRWVEQLKNPPSDDLRATQQAAELVELLKRCRPYKQDVRLQDGWKMALELFRKIVREELQLVEKELNTDSSQASRAKLKGRYAKVLEWLAEVPEAELNAERFEAELGRLRCDARDEEPNWKQIQAGLGKLDPTESHASDLSNAVYRRLQMLGEFHQLPADAWPQYGVLLDTCEFLWTNEASSPLSEAIPDWERRKVEEARGKLLSWAGQSLDKAESVPVEQSRFLEIAKARFPRLDLEAKLLESERLEKEGMYGKALDILKKLESRTDRNDSLTFRIEDAEFRIHLANVAGEPTFDFTLDDLKGRAKRCDRIELLSNALLARVAAWRSGNDRKRAANALAFWDSVAPGANDPFWMARKQCYEARVLEEALSARPDYQQILKDCTECEASKSRDTLLRAASIEAGLETAQGESKPAPALSFASANAVGGEEGAYCLYVYFLRQMQESDNTIDDESKGPSEEVQAWLTNTAANWEAPSHSWQSAESRVARRINMLVWAASPHLCNDDWILKGRQPLLVEANCFDRAQTLYTRLAQKAMSPLLASNDLLRYRLAEMRWAWEKHFRDPGMVEDWKTFEYLTRTLIDDESALAFIVKHNCSLLVRLVRGIALGKLERKGASALLTSAFTEKRITDHLLARDVKFEFDDYSIHKRLVEPVFEVTKNLPPKDVDTSRLLALIHYSRARLAQREPAIGRNNEEVFEDFQTADRYAPKSSRILIGAGRSLLQTRLIPADQIKLLGRFVEDLIGSSHESDPGFQGLKGWHLLLTSRNETNTKKRLELLGQAVTSFQAAIDLHDNREIERKLVDEFKSSYHEGASQSRLEAAFHSGNADEKAVYLNDAIGHAEKAAGLTQRHLPEVAYFCWGNALEDRAYYLPHRPSKDVEADYELSQSKFRLAVSEAQKFTPAIAEREGRVRVAECRFHHGRCLYRHGEHLRILDKLPADAPDRYFREAAEELHKAIDGFEDARNLLKAEAHCWRGKALSWQWRIRSNKTTDAGGELRETRDRADTELDDAVASIKAADPKELPSYLYERASHRFWCHQEIDEMFNAFDELQSRPAGIDAKALEQMIRIVEIPLENSWIKFDVATQEKLSLRLRGFLDAASTLPIRLECRAAGVKVACFYFMRRAHEMKTEEIPGPMATLKSDVQRVRSQFSPPGNATPRKIVADMEFHWGRLNLQLAVKNWELRVKGKDTKSSIEWLKSAFEASAIAAELRDKELDSAAALHFEKLKKETIPDLDLLRKEWGDEKFKAIESHLVAASGPARLNARHSISLLGVLAEKNPEYEHEVLEWQVKNFSRYLSVVGPLRFLTLHRFEDEPRIRNLFKEQRYLITQEEVGLFKSKIDAGTPKPPSN